MNAWFETGTREVYAKSLVACRHPIYAAVRIVATVCMALMGFQAAADETAFPDLNYRLGEGLRLADTGFSLGGYATASYENLRHAPSRTALDNLSLFVWWQGESRWKFFSEFDYENVLASRSQEGEDRYLALERLYLDYAVTDTTTLRVGKFLTPIGRWNLIHATPLVWTSSRPLITTQTFPTNATGLMVNGTLPAVANGTEYSLYASNGNEIRPNPALDPFSGAIGAHVTFPVLANAQVGFSYASFEQEKTRGEKKQLVGLDFLWSRNRYEVSAEGIYRFSDNGSDWDEKGAFGQLVVPLSEKLYAVARYEIFRKAQETLTTHLWVAGLNYRVTPAVVLKAEWVGSTHNHIDAPEGFLSSVSLLF
jgi:opacity protein-like surface antigen